MAEPLKNYINPSLLEHACNAMLVAWPDFDREAFFQKTFDADWADRALKERLRHVAGVLKQVLPTGYENALSVLVRSVQGLIDHEGEKLTFEYGFWTDFVAQFGLDQPESSLDALETLTRWTTAEYAIRPFLLHHPERTYARMAVWSEHPSPMVRRLSSEGFRPRLPWGMGLPALKSDPSPILPVLEKLKNDPAETVRRSVANNLNDISKDHPQLALEIARRWLGQSSETDWVVRHACRGLLKNGHPGALSLFGFDVQQNHIALLHFQTEKEVQIGGYLPFTVILQNQGGAPEPFRLAYRIDYRKAGGKVSGKTFHLREGVLEPGEQLEVDRRHPFYDMTTRKHHPGTHRLEVLVNGVALGAEKFEVL